MDKKFNGHRVNGFSSYSINPHTKLKGNNKEEAYCMHFTCDRSTKCDRMRSVINRIS